MSILTNSLDVLVDYNRANLAKVEKATKRGRRLIICVQVYLVVGALGIISVFIWSYSSK